MRITKKYAGPDCIGKQIFQPLEDRSMLGSNSALHAANVSPEEIRKDEKELEILEKIFRTRLGIPQRVGGKSSYLQSSTGPSGLKLDRSHDKSMSPSYLPSNSYDNYDSVSLPDDHQIVLSTSQNVFPLPSFITLKEKSLPSNESSQTIQSHISSGNNSSNGNNTNSSGVMMRRAVSAPELKSMSGSSPWKEVPNDSTPATNVQLLKGATEKRKYLSHSRPLQQGLASAGASMRKSRSMFDLMDFEDYYGDDFAAG